MPRVGGISMMTCCVSHKNHLRSRLDRLPHRTAAVPASKHAILIRYTPRSSFAEVQESQHAAQLACRYSAGPISSFLVISDPAAAKHVLRATDNPKNPLYDKGLVREVISHGPPCATSPGPGAVAAPPDAPALMLRQPAKLLWGTAVATWRMALDCRDEVAGGRWSAGFKAVPVQQSNGMRVDDGVGSLRE